MPTTLRGAVRYLVLLAGTIIAILVMVLLNAAGSHTATAAGAGYSVALASPAPPTAATTFMWVVTGTSPGAGQEISYLKLTGVWSGSQVLSALSSAGRVSANAQTGEIKVDSLSDASLPLTLTVTFGQAFASSSAGTSVTIRSGYMTSGTALSTGGPTNPRNQTPTATPIVFMTPLPVATCGTGSPYVIVPSTGATVVPGTQDIGNHCDDCTTAIRLPFFFRLYGVPFNQAIVGSNGTLGFLINNNPSSNTCLPNPRFVAMILPQWDDLRTDITGTIPSGIFTSTSGQAPNRIFNIEWRAVYFGTTTSLNFETRLYENQNRFDLVYGQIPGHGNTAVVGVQSLPFYTLTQFECNTGGLAPGLQLEFRPYACGEPTFTPRPTSPATATSIGTTTPTTTPSAAGTSTPTNAATSTGTTTSTPTSVASSTTTPTNTPANTTTDTPTNFPTITATSTNAPSDTPTDTATALPSDTPTSTPTDTFTATITPTDTPTSTNTSMPSDTPTTTPTDTPTTTETPSSTSSATATATLAPSNTPTATATNTPQPTDTPADTATATETPELGAPQPDLSVPSNLGTSSAFLYTGNNPVQTGVISGTINQQLVAVLRGTVYTRDGQPLSGVTIQILGHPEYGQTLTRADGQFDMAVNGGGALTITYAKDGYLPIQRQVSTTWQDYAHIPDVVMIPLDTQVTTVDFTGNNAMQVAQSSTVSDTSGTRRETLLFPAGITGVMTLTNGVTQTLTTGHVRVTEYTVGTAGPDAMPAALPANSAYTYADEFSLDEALQAGATGVGFSQPVIAYVDNFLGLPVGGGVPIGRYDRVRGTWVASANGRIVKILSITNGMADLDIDGSGTPASPSALAALGVTDAERTQLAILFQPLQSFWRVPLLQDDPEDINWPFGCRTTPCPPPNQPNPNPNPPPDNPDPDPCGSVIGCQSQTLGESIDIVGSPFQLHYESDRVPGRLLGSVHIQLSGATIPSSLRGIDLEVQVAGQDFTESFPAAANQSTAFNWNGRDIYGRPVQGDPPITVRIGYVYDLWYAGPQRFGDYGTGALMSGSYDRGTYILWQEWKGKLSVWDARALGLGAWSLSPHHVYDPVGKVLYMGNGDRRNLVAQSLAIINTVAGNGQLGSATIGQPAAQASISAPQSAIVGPDGRSYIIQDTSPVRIYKVDAVGTITATWGSGVTCSPTTAPCGDGGPVTQAQFRGPQQLITAPDGSVYIADSSDNRIRQVGPGPSYIITTVAGTGQPCSSTTAACGDGGLATQAQLVDPQGIALGSDGSLYIADTLDNRIRKVGPDGIITTVAGTGALGYSGDGGPANVAQMQQPYGVAVGPDGSLYIADSFNRRVRRVGPDGIITTFAGGGQSCPQAPCGDGGPATATDIHPGGIAVGQDGSVYISDGVDSQPTVRIRRIGPDGIITTLTGTGLRGYSGDGGPAPAAQIFTSLPPSEPSGLSVGPDGALYIADRGNNRVRRISSAVPGQSLSNLAIASEDGSEVYIFDANGRHLRTVDQLTGALKYQFGYDSAGRLMTVTDGNANVTTIQRDGNGNPTAIVAPNGQITTLQLDGNGYLSQVTNPAGEVVQLSSSTSGLLQTFVDPNGGFHRFTYDALGRLTSDQDPAGGNITLSRVENMANYTITLSTALSRTTTYSVQELTTGDEQRTTTDAAGHRTLTLLKNDGSRITQYPDGTVVTQTLGPDPRWGMQAPVITNMTVTLPSGLTQIFAGSRRVQLANTNDLFSLQTLTDTVSSNGQTYTTIYTTTTNTLMSISPAGRQTTNLLDSKGRVIQSQMAGLLPVAYAYDSNGRLTTISQGIRTTALTYDSHWNIASVTDPLSETASFAYDNVGRLVTKTLPDGRQIAYSHDANGNLTGLTPPGRPQHTFSYTPADQTQSYSPPDVGAGTSVTQFSYNPDRQTTSVALPDGQTIQVGYDSAGRPNLFTYPQGNIALSYDPATGNITNIAGPGGANVAFGYDGSLLTSSTWSGTTSGSVRYIYDNNERITGESVNGGSNVSFGYDADGLLTQAGALTITRNVQNGLPTGSALGSITDTLNYSSLGEVVGYDAVAGGTSVYAFQDTHDDLGRISQRIEMIAGITHTLAYTYDLAGRLTQARQDGALVSQYSYDSNGNRLSYIGTSGTVNGTYDNQDRLLQYGTNAYTYTVSGDLQTKTDSTTGQQTTYAYDALGNLLGVTLPDGTHIDYTVDGVGRRIGKKVNGTFVQGFLYDGQLAPVAELDGNSNIVSRFVYAHGVNVPAYMVKAGVTYRIITDNLGSPRLVVNATTGQIVQQMNYDEFGNVTLDTNPGFQPFGFAGGLYDRDTKFVHYDTREYITETGRWLTKDRANFGGRDMNLYGYALGDPVNSQDPYGLWTISIGVNISGGLGGGQASVGAGVVIDGNGHIGGYVTAGTGAGAEADVNVSGQVQVTNAGNINDLNGPSISGSAGLGARIHAGVNVIGGRQSNGRPYGGGGIDVGAGVGAGAAIGPTGTKIIPIWPPAPDPQPIPNPPSPPGPAPAPAPCRGGSQGPGDFPGPNPNTGYA